MIKCLYLKICAWFAKVRADRAIKRAERASERAKTAVARYGKACKKHLEYSNIGKYAVTPHPENMPVIGENRVDIENDPEARELQQKIQKSFELLFCTPRGEE